MRAEERFFEGERDDRTEHDETRTQALLLDLETTGLDPDKDHILEIAMSEAKLNDPFNATPVFHAVLPLPDICITPENLVVVQMHTKNGLFEDCAKSSMLLRDVEAEMLSILVPPQTRNLGDRLSEEPPRLDPKERHVLAGSSVHFDLSFLRKKLPIVAALFSHRVYDVSAVKLFCQSLGMPKLPRAEAHRAKDDVLESIDHTKKCADWIKRGAPGA